MVYLKLFWSFLQIGLFSIGGGYTSLPLIQKQVIELNNWLNMSEFIDIVTISQMTPGPIAINAATFVGTIGGGLLGAIIATIGSITPSCVIVITIAYFYYKYQDLWVIHGTLRGLRPVVVSLITFAGITLLLTALFKSNATSWFNIDLRNIDYIAATLFTISLIILRKLKINPIYVMFGTGFIGFILYSLFNY